MGLARDTGKYESGEDGERWEDDPGRVVRPDFIERIWPRLGRYFIGTGGTNKRADGRNCSGLGLNGGNR